MYNEIGGSTGDGDGGGGLFQIYTAMDMLCIKINKFCGIHVYLADILYRDEYKCGLYWYLARITRRLVVQFSYCAFITFLNPFKLIAFVQIRMLIITEIMRM